MKITMGYRKIDPFAAYIDKAMMRSSNLRLAGQLVAAVLDGVFCEGACSAIYSAYLVGTPSDVMKAGAVSLVSSSFFSQAGSATGGMSGFLGGGNCGQGALSAAVAKGITIGLTMHYGQSTIPFEIGFTSAVVSGGIAAELGGGKFANGAVTGAFGYLLNYCTQNRCFDRKFSFSDAVDHWRNGNGSTVTDVKASELNLNGATYTKNPSGTYQIRTSIKYDTGAIYGTVTGVLNTDGTMSIKPDFYDFDLKNPLKANTFKEFGRLVIRDVLTGVGAVVNGFGTPYRIEFSGSIPTPSNLPK